VYLVDARRSRQPQWLVAREGMETTPANRWSTAQTNGSAITWRSASSACQRSAPNETSVMNKSSTDEPLARPIHFTRQRKGIGVDSEGVTWVGLTDLVDKRRIGASNDGASYWHHEVLVHALHNHVDSTTTVRLLCDSSQRIVKTRYVNSSFELQCDKPC